ncbi:MAG: DUF2848 domain-containing protein [Pseudomonadota bacterium]
MRFQTPDGPLDVTPTALVVAGWTARDAAAVAHHIAELAAIGIPAPSATPLFYRVGVDLLTQADRIEVLGPDTSGEVEPLILRAGGRLWLGLGSDHTDRALERVSVAAAKQACPKPVCRELWPLDALADRLDALELRAEIAEAEAWVTYQEGTLAAIRPLLDLVAAADLAEGAAMLCGTLAARGGVRPAARFRATLTDPVTGEALSMAYDAEVLPLVA